MHVEMYILFSSACDSGEMRKGQENISRPCRVCLCCQMVTPIMGVLVYPEQRLVSAGAKAAEPGKKGGFSCSPSRKILRTRTEYQATWQEAEPARKLPRQSTCQGRHSTVFF